MTKTFDLRSSYYPDFSETKLTDCGDYLEFKINKYSIHHRKEDDESVTWTAHHLLDSFLMNIAKELSYRYDKKANQWYVINANTCREWYQPKIEDWYVEYLRVQNHSPSPSVQTHY